MTPVQETLFAQLGGRRMLVMTGAQVSSDGPNKLIFKLPRNRPAVKIFGADETTEFAKVRAVTIRYDEGTDTYEVATLPHGRAAKLSEPITDVYADSLRDLFESLTGLRVSL